MSAAAELIQHCRTQLNKVIVGQQQAIDQMVLTLLCGGHALLEGVPGMAKTLLAKALARILRIDYQRVQCTSDLMPADILGTNVLNTATASFSLHRGPVFTELLLVDEINRMPPRTQAALLECMEERQVTIDGARHQLSPVFTVIGTENPIEFEGTYPLPEAQLDRFLLKISVDYLSVDEEIQVLGSHHSGFDAQRLDRVQFETLEKQALLAAREEVKAVRIEDTLFRYLIQLIRRTRDWPSIALGASPRAAVTLMLAAKGTAAMDGRDYLIPDDIQSSALPVLRHRLLLKPEAELEGVASDQVIRDVIKAVEVPR
ncbi:MAG: MoxR family ATPase [Acidobacteria bacterium]|nr:MoxR family ATPase [Acidobacteriota bacterium]MBV9435199.1 MoxR family ATPase [Acidobacteriota bacterium]